VQRFPEAASAYARLAELAPGDASVLADYADALALARGRRLAGEPLALAQRALELDPAQWKARALVASEAFQRKDYRAAIGHWETLRVAVPPDSAMARTYAGYIDQARRLAASSRGRAED
jgi:cytochrome c-type biogenesis protein CcmH